MRWLVYDVLGKEDVVDNALAIVLLGCALVDTPVAIDDKLRAFVSKRPSQRRLQPSQAAGACRTASVP